MTVEPPQPFYTLCGQLARGSLVVALVVLCTVACAGRLDPGATIGTVTEVSGLPTLVRNGGTYVLDAGSEIRLRDLLETPAASRVKVRLNDGTVLHAGGETRFVVHRFRPARTIFGPRLSLTQNTGILALEAGTMAHGWRSRFELRTPLARVRVRDADLLSVFEATTSGLDFTMTRGGRLSIRNAHGRTRLETPGYGVTVQSGSRARPPAPRSEAQLAAWRQMIAEPVDE